MMKKYTSLWLGVLVAASAPSYAQSFSNNLNLGAVTTGTAGSGRAASESSQAPNMNPAAIPFSKGYLINTNYSTVDSGSAFNIGLTDNLPDTVVPTSLIYTQLTGTTRTHQNLQQQQGQLEFANFYSKSLAVGFGARYQIDQINDTRWTQTNIFLGSIYTVTPKIGVGLVFDNLLNPDSNIPLPYRYNPTTSLAVNYNAMKILRLKMDVTTASNDSWALPTLSAGLETYVNSYLVLRGGVNKNYETGLDGSALGLGFLGPKFSVNYGFYNCTQDQTQSRQALDLSVPIW